MPSNLSTLAPATRNMPAGKADLAAVAEPRWQKGRSRHCDAARVANHWSTNAGAPARADYRWATLKLSPWPYLVPLLLLWGLSLLLLLWQKDLGATVLMLGIALSMMYVATGRKTFVGVGLL